MRQQRTATRLGLTALAMSLLASPSHAQGTAAATPLPWQKDTAHHAAPNLQEILPWLIGEEAAKVETGKSAAAAWTTQVAEPHAPVEPVVAESGMAASRLETGAIGSSGLVLKAPLAAAQAGPGGVFKTAAKPAPKDNGKDTAKQDAPAAPPTKIKRSIALPGDRPVDQSHVDEVTADRVGEETLERSPDEARVVAPPAAKPIAADQIGQPAQEPSAPAQTGSPEAEATVVTDAPDVSAASAAVEPVTSRSTGPSAEARSVRVTPAAAAAARLSVSAAKAVKGTPRPAGFAAQGLQDAAAIGPADPSDAPDAVAPTTLAQAAVPEQGAPEGGPVEVNPVDSVPALPVAEEAPAIPDPLPDAVVTPVPKQGNAAAAPVPSQQARDVVPAVSPAGPVPAANSKPAAPSRLADGANVAQQYCFNIADAAKDARYAWQKKTLADIEAELNKRIALLDARTAEYQKWLARRDDFIRNAEESVVKIYSGMRPDAAATQLSLMNEESAAAVVSKLSTRNASAVLNEMEPAKAAKLTMIITGAAKLKRKKELQQQKTAPAQTQGAASPAPATQAAGAPQTQGGRS